MLRACQERVYQTAESWWRSDGMFKPRYAVYDHDIHLKVIYHIYYMVWIIMSLYGVIDYHVTLSKGHMIVNHPICIDV